MWKWFFLSLHLQHLGIEKDNIIQEIMEEEVPPDAVQDETLYNLPKLDNNAFVGLFVEDIVSPSQFHIRIYSGETSDELENIMIEMRWRYIWPVFESSRDICTNFTKIKGRGRIYFVYGCL